MALPLLAIVGWSGTGKTTLLKKVIVLLRQRGIRPGLIKHTHHDMDIDTPGKDSYELRKAGADQVIVFNQQRWALMMETPAPSDWDLRKLAGRMDATSLDMILVEGFKQEKIDKIVLWREETGGDLATLLDEYVIAIATDMPTGTRLPELDINNPDQVTDFICQWLKST